MLTVQDSKVMSDEFNVIRIFSSGNYAQKLIIKFSNY
jgi:hypothetical protein